MEKIYEVSCEVAGKYACFSQPSCSPDAVRSFEVPTYNAVRGIFYSIASLKECDVRPFRVDICKPIIFSELCYNYKGPERKQQDIKNKNTRMSSLFILNNVCYKLYAHVSNQPEVGLSINKAHQYQDMFFRNLRNTAYRSIPFLGLRNMIPNYIGFLRESTEPLNDINLKVSYLNSSTQIFDDFLVEEGVMHYAKRIK